MRQEKLIAIKDARINHNIEETAIHSPEETGLIQVITSHEIYYIESSQLQLLEKYIDFRSSLDIKPE